MLIRLFVFTAALWLGLESAMLAQSAPEYLTDGEITIRLKDGTIYTFDANKYKISQRELEKAKPKPKPKPKKKKIAKSYAQYERTYEGGNSYPPERQMPVRSYADILPPSVYNTDTKNTITALGGVSDSGFLFEEKKLSNGATEVNISKRQIIVLGLSYNRKFLKHMSANVVLLSNATYLFGVGYDW